MVNPPDGGTLAVSGSMRQRGEESWQLRVHAGREPITNRKRYVERKFRGTSAKRPKRWRHWSPRTTPRSTKEGTVGALFNEWLDHATPSFSPKTVATTRMYLDAPIIPAIGSLSANKLTASELDRFLPAPTGRGRCPWPLLARHHPESARDHSPGTDPRGAMGMDRPQPRHRPSPPRVPLRDLRPPGPDEVVRLFRLAEEVDPDLGTFVMLAASSGARRGEASTYASPAGSLRWETQGRERRQPGPKEVRIIQ